MSLTNPNKVVTEERLNEYHNTILPYLGGMPDILANKFSKADLYSTDEKMIGQWTDGKPLYQKSFHYDTPIIFNEYGNSSPVFAKIPNIDRIIDVKFMRTGINFPAGIFDVWLNGGTTDELCASYIRGAQPTSYNPSISDITVQYTKTTDSAVSIGNDTDYSTTEKIIGTWIDGKPLYQKTIQFTSSYDLSDLSYDYIQVTSARLITTSGVIIPSVSEYYNANDWYRIYIAGSGMAIQKGTSVTVGNIVVTIQYTKTTN